MPSDLELLEEASSILKRGGKIALCTIIEKKGSGPREPGGKMIVSIDGETVGTIGGGEFEVAVVEEALNALREGKPRRAVFALHGRGEGAIIPTGLICGGELTVFIDVLEPEQRMIIIGSGDVACYLAKLAGVVGYRILILADKEEHVDKEEFPMAQSIIVGDLEETLNELDLTPQDYVVIVHGEPEQDYLALEKTLQNEPAYIGLLGSRAKVKTLLNRLTESGVNREDIERIHAPVGLDIGGQTPAEIGISILAEMIAIRRKS